MKKYLLWLNNGDSYEDREDILLGVFSDKRKAQRAKIEADETIKAAFVNYFERFPSASMYYASPSVFGTSCRQNYELSIIAAQEDELKPL